ncbi:MAG: EAL domain-containing protein [Acidisphaera sp.]|nr:EAL domain-containing protein [Acidisphaera sp.]
MRRVYILGCLVQQHDLRLVALAFLVCLMACFTALNLLSRAQATEGGLRLAWLFGAAFAFGSGVWTTHFVAELAYRPGVPVEYAVGDTLISAAVPIAGAMLALLIFGARPGRAWPVAAGGVVLGGAVAGMHFLGMGAMRLPGTILFNPLLVAASVVSAMALSVLGLSRSDGEAKLADRLLGAVTLTLAVCTLHFTAMAAVTVLPGTLPARHEDVISAGPLAITVATASLAILMLSLFGALVDQHLATRVAREGKRLRQLTASTFEGLVIHREGIVLDVNEAFCRMVGQAPDAVRGRHVLDFVQPGSAAEIAERLKTPERLRSPVPIEIALTGAGGVPLPAELLCRQIEYNGADAVVASVRDLSDRKRAEEQIRHLAHHDAVTGLPNRFLFNDRFVQALELAERTGAGVAVLCLDLDRFKFVNDLLGHEGGDRLLVEVAERLRATVRGVDTVARLGGDEFAVAQPLADQPQSAAALASRLIEALARPFDIDGQHVQIGVSIGIAISPTDGRTGPKLLKNADTALYRAKAEGRNRLCFFEPEMDLRLQGRRALEQDLRQALSRGELALNYQPLFDCRSGELEGFEALLRWTHPVRGQVSPAEFIPLAEESGLILPIGRWALETACAEAVAWQDRLRVAVNLSPAQFKQQDLPVMVAEILARTGLPARRLELEVTEGLLIDNTERALGILRELKDLGVRISLDDFGTGYSSLSYLRRFPFDKLKIDKSFVKASDEDAEAAAIVSTIIAMGYNLGLSITAEGVETQSQLDLLRSQACHQAQGFLLGRPLPAREVSEMLSRRAEPAIAA